MVSARGRRQKECSVDKCCKEAHGRGYCRSHYMSWWRHGDVKYVDQNRVHSETGVEKHPLKYVYRTMVSRCYSPNSRKYSRYGARGIRVCDRWMEPLTQGFWNFVEDMGERPEGYTLDRIDNDGHYSPDNCRWASQFTQQNNRGNNRKVVGVYPTPSNTFRADIMINGKKFSKKFKTFEAAVAQRKEWEVEYAYNS